MKKRILFFFLVTMAWSLNAAPVDGSKALKIASNFMRLRLEEKSRADVPLQLTEWKDNSLSNLYLFAGDHAFVLLSADDRAFPVLGYSLDNGFDVSFIPANTLEWLQMYNQGIQDLKDHGVEATVEVKESWRQLMEGVLPSVENRAEVAPLIATHWGQREPYNYSCPGHALTGCVATTMSQIMRYYEYPNQGYGYHSYNHPVYGTLYASFGQTTYDWDNMPLTASAYSPSIVQQALGTLFYQCGVSVDMDYAIDGSAAYSTDVPEVMKTYFKYAPDIVLDDKSYYSQSAWETLIKDELNASRPVYYSANGNAGGHAFLCDGYDAYDKFHMNWGWSGNYDGYYQIGALNPDEETHYNNLNRIITHIYPLEYAIEAPSYLAVNCDDGWVNLSWPAVPGAAYYKVYRNDEVLAPNVSGTSYVDRDFSYGDQVYYVKAITSAGDRSPRSEKVEVTVDYALPAPTEVSASVNHEGGDNVVLTWTMETEGEVDMHYGVAETPQNGSGYNGYGTYWAQRYTRTDVEYHAGMLVSEVQVYLRAVGNYTLTVCNGDPLSNPSMVYQQPYTCNSIGWNTITLTTPMVLDYSNDLWVMLYAPASISYPAAFCGYAGDGMPYASYIRKDGQSWYSYYEENRSWMFRVILRDPAFTYSVAKNEVIIAENLTEPSFIDRNISAGETEYNIMAFDGTYESMWSETFTLTLYSVQAESSNATMGTVSGQGLYAKNEQATLKATAKPGFHFVEWKENGTTVSNMPTYTFTVIGNKNLVARFENGSSVEELESSLKVLPNPTSGQLFVESVEPIERMELVTLEGAVVASHLVDGCRAEWSLHSYAQGVYLLRLYTDKGLIVKKLVLIE